MVVLRYVDVDIGFLLFFGGGWDLIVILYIYFLDMFFGLMLYIKVLYVCLVWLMLCVIVVRFCVFWLFVYFIVCNKWIG